MTVAGWGVTREGSSFLAEMLQEVKVPVVSVSRCKQALGQYDITDNMLCAGGVEDQDACQGDSGGPLMGTEPGTKQVSTVTTSVCFKKLFIHLYGSKSNFLILSQTR